MRQHGRSRIQLAGQPALPSRIEFEHLARLVDGPDDESRQDIAVEFVQLQVESCHDAEVPAAAADCPEEVGLVVCADVTDLAVRRDDFGADEVIDCQPVPAIQSAEAAAGRETADARVGNHAGRRDEAVRERGIVEVTEQRAATRTCNLPLGVDVHAVHLREIDHDAVVADGFARPAVASTADCRQHAVITCEIDSLDHVVG